MAPGPGARGPSLFRRLLSSHARGGGRRASRINQRRTSRFLSPIDRGFSSGRRCAPERRRPRGVAALERAVLTPRAHLAASNPPRAASSSADSASGLRRARFACSPSPPPRPSASPRPLPTRARRRSRSERARRARAARTRARTAAREARRGSRPRRGSPRASPRRSRRRSSRFLPRSRTRRSRRRRPRFALRRRGRYHRPRRRRPVGGAREQEAEAAKAAGKGTKKR